MLIGTDALSHASVMDGRQTNGPTLGTLDCERLQPIRTRKSDFVIKCLISLPMGALESLLFEQFSSLRENFNILKNTLSTHLCTKSLTQLLHKFSAITVFGFYTNYNEPDYNIRYYINIHVTTRTEIDNNCFYNREYHLFYRLVIIVVSSLKFNGASADNIYNIIFLMSWS